MYQFGVRGHDAGDCVIRTCGNRGAVGEPVEAAVLNIQCAMKGGLQSLWRSRASAELEAIVIRH